MTEPASPSDGAPKRGAPDHSAHVRTPTVRWLRRASWVLMGGAGVLVAYIVLLVGWQSVQQSHLSEAWTHDHPTVADVAALRTPAHHAHLADGQAVAKLALPSVGFDSIVAEGADRGILTGGPGHDDRTAYPGEGGVVLISNHNGFSMSWGNLQPGDSAVVEMPYGRFKYRITSRTIVPGDDTGVLAKQRTGETLVLSTCWPLWQGALAGERLVFEATPA